jgi:hypothetical protein
MGEAASFSHKPPFLIGHVKTVNRGYERAVAYGGTKIHQDSFYFAVALQRPRLINAKAVP